MTTLPGTPSAAPRKQRFWVLAAVTVVTTALLLVPILRLWDADLNVPFDYRGDANSGAMLVKATLDHGWYETNPSLGAPFAQHMHDYPFADNLHLVVMKVIGVGGASYATVMNLYYLLGYLLVALTAVWAMRRLGLSPPVAFVLAVLYTFLPMHESRGEVHLFVGAYYAVPVACFLILRSLGDRPLLGLREGDGSWWKRLWTWPNVGAALACVLIGSSGSYVAAFSILLLLFAVLINTWQWRGVAAVASTLLLVAMVAFSFGVNRLPDDLYALRHGSNSQAMYRNVADSEEYGLKIAALLLPNEQHRIGKLRSWSHKFHDESLIEGEAGQSLGLIGAAGLVTLLAAAVLTPFSRRKLPEVVERVQQLGAVTVGTILLGTVAGLSSLVAFLVVDLRSWNRLSSFVGFFALLTVGLVIDHWRVWLRRGLWALLAAMLIGGLADQTWTPPSYAPGKATFASDADFVHAIERRLGDGAMVFQLPYNAFPEAPGFVHGDYYDHLRGYLHSSSLRWSYGGVRGRPEADWQKSLLDQPSIDKKWLDRIAALGFAGIYVDRYGYEDYGRAVEASIASIASGAPITSRDERLVFFDIRSYAKALRSAEPDRVQALRDAVFTPVRNAR